MLYRNGSGTVDVVLPKKERDDVFQYVLVSKKWKQKKGKKLRRGWKKRRIEVRKQWKYADYILSNAWKARKREHFKKFGKLCAACGSTEGLSVHHTSYRHVGNERDDELVTLCWPCHEAVHDEYGVHLDLKDQTTQLIINTQEANELHELTKYF